MNKSLARMLAAAGLVAPLAGCASDYRDWVDPCWPERYNHTARRETIEAFAPQVQNGHILDQTIWNYMFDAGTEDLNGYGRYKLDYLVRRRPAPDANVFLQTAHDVVYDPAAPEKAGEMRRELDLKRVAAIKQYLAAQMVGRPMNFEVGIHDPYPVGMPAQTATLIVNRNWLGVSGTIGTGSGGGGDSGAGGQGNAGSSSSAATTGGGGSAAYGSSTNNSGGSSSSSSSAPR